LQRKSEMEQNQDPHHETKRLHPFSRLLSGRRKEPALIEIRRAAKKLSDNRLREDASGLVQIEPEDMVPETTPAKLLGYYSADGITYALRELGISGIVEQLGFRDFQVKVTGDAWCQLFRINASAEGKTHLIAEGRFRKTSGPLPGDTFLKKEYGEKTYSLVIIEWFLLQNPLAEFSPHKPQLPEQVFPGLGIKDEVMEILFAVARRLELDAYILNAMFLHNAFIYSPEFFFCNPKRQAEYLAIKRDAQDHSLQDLTLAVEGGFVYLQGQEEPYRWTGDTMVRPLSKELSGAFHRYGYRQLVENMAEEINYHFDWDSFREHRDVLLKKLLDIPPRNK
jgi:hypothetical protein